MVCGSAFPVPNINRYVGADHTLCVIIISLHCLPGIVFFISSLFFIAFYFCDLQFLGSQTGDNSCQWATVGWPIKFKFGMGKVQDLNNPF